MTEIKFLKGDATLPQGEGPKFIIHICNDVGAWGKGFVLAISKRWPEPEREYRNWYATRVVSFSLGMIQTVQVEPQLHVVNMIAQSGLRWTNKTQPPIRYDALETCLKQVANRAKALNASVHMPRIGCGLAGGKWNLIEPIIIETLCSNNIPVSVYDL